MSDIKVGSCIEVDSFIIETEYVGINDTFHFSINGMELKEHGLDIPTWNDIRDYHPIPVSGFVLKIKDLDKFTCFMLEYGEWIR